MLRQGRPILRKVKSAARWLIVAAIVAGWARSYWRHDFVEVRYVHPSPSREVSEPSFASGKGGCCLSFEGSWWNPGDEDLRHRYPNGWELTATTSAPDYPWRYLCRLAWEDYSLGERGRQGYGQTIYAPHAVLLALMLARPAAGRIARVVRDQRHQRRSGLCPSCGYDLRATPGRCPECGAGRAPEGV